MSLTVKAYRLVSGEPDPEIRRFSVDPDVSTSYVYMRGKVTQMFPVLKNSSFDLFWKDNENDLIAFSSDDELTEALGFVTDGVFKVYIKETEKRGTPRKPSNNGVVHDGVVCDACDGKVVGNRYKCATCPDYDLCGSCESEGHHPEHDMMRITDPKNSVWLGLGGMFPMPPWCPPPPPHHGHGPPPPPHHRGRGHPGPWGPRGRGHPFHHMMNRCRRWMAGEEECAEREGQGERKTRQDRCKEKAQRTEAKSTPAPEKAGEKAENADGEGSPGSPTESFLRNIGENVAAMLDPLGIDVEIDVEHKGNRQSCGQPEPGAGQYGGPWAYAAGPFGFWANAQEGKNQPQTSSSPKKDETKTQQDGTSHDAPVVEMETGETTSHVTKEARPEGNETATAMDAPGEEQQGAAAQSGSTKAKPAGSDRSPDRDWTFIETRDDNASRSSQGGTTGGLYPEVPKPPTETPAADPVIANALDHMFAMGFSDDGGWLTRLLEVTAGDINKALDAIRANRTK